MDLGHADTGLLEAARDAVAAGDAARIQGAIDGALAHPSTSAATLLALADIAIEHYQYEPALALAERAIALAPTHPAPHFKHALACHGLSRLDDAERGYLEAHRLDPGFGQALNNLGCLYLYHGRREAATRAFERAVVADPALPEPHANLGAQRLAAGDVDRALADFARAIEQDPAYGDAHLQRIQCLLNTNRASELDAAYRDADVAVAADRRGWLELRLALMLPEFMHSREAIAASRQRLSSRLARLESGSAPIAEPLGAIPSSTWFFLAYHGLDDRPLVERIARMFLRRCPGLSYVAPHCMPGALRPPGRIRIGFASAHLREHTIGKLNMGVIGGLPHDRFEVTVFVPPQAPNRVEDYLRSRVREVVVLERSIAAAQRQIAAASLDILVYPDIGMEPFTYFLAFSRLAPVQCVTWGHPMSTGIPTIDHFVTHEACELPGSERYYTERLLRIPSGDALTYYFRPDTSGLDKKRPDFGLGDREHIYFCPQTLFKLHPDQDEAFEAILDADPDAVLLFLEGDMPVLKQALLARFRSRMPRHLARVRFLPALPFRDFLNLAKLSDVVLDTFVFGGGNSTMEIFAVGRLVVTLPSDQLRGRLGCACCRRMGMEELVALDARDYAAKAVRIATDPAYRSTLEAKLAARSGLLFEDGNFVSHFATLLSEAHEAALTGRGVRPAVTPR